jgi:hypothetical protein
MARLQAQIWQDHGGKTMKTVVSPGMWSARDVFGMFSCFLRDYGLVLRLTMIREMVIMII